MASASATSPSTRATGISSSSPGCRSMRSCIGDQGSRSPVMRIWFALLVAPTLALTDQSVAYATVGWACSHQQVLAVHAVHALFLLATAAGTVLAWQLWLSTAPAGSGSEPIARQHFLAGLATASGALSALTIAAMWIPTFVI